VGGGSTLDISGATITTNQATIKLDGPGSKFAAINGLQSNSGAFSLLGGRVFTTAGPLANAGALEVGTSSGLVMATGTTLTNTGTIFGNGTIQGRVANAGLVSPGNSPGTLTIAGEFAQNVAGTISFEIGGLTAGSFDVLTILGDASLAGSVDLFFTDGFAPHAGDTFDLMTVSGTRSGDFTALHIVNLQPGFQYTAGFQDQTYRLTALNDGTFVPEPSTFLLLFAGATIVSLCAWRRRKRIRHAILQGK
jgi:hypothetical protein